MPLEGLRGYRHTQGQDNACLDVSGTCWDHSAQGKHGVCVSRQSDSGHHEAAAHSCALASVRHGLRRSFLLTAHNTHVKQGDGASFPRKLHTWIQKGYAA